MIKFDNTAVMNFENAMRGARNPLNSWARSDSSYDENGNFVFGPNDLDLAKRLCQAGNDHRKFIRQIFISVDITAPIYWWKEYDTYKVGTVANSTSTMHKIHSKPFELSDFSTDHMTDEALEAMKLMVASLENIRLKTVPSLTPTASATSRSVSLSSSRFALIISFVVIKVPQLYTFPYLYL